MRKSLFCAALAGAALLATATVAEAHARLMIANPAANTRVAAPREVRLRFSEPLIARLSAIAVLDQAGHAVPTGRFGLSQDRRQLAVALPARLAAGTYRVNWRVVSADPHRITGG